MKRFSEMEALEYYAGGFIPVGLKDTEISGTAFPAVVSEVLINAFQTGIRRAVRDLSFQLLLNLTYQDGAPMVTVGGWFHGTDETPISLEEHGPLPFWPPSKEAPYEIGVPLLTVREKAALDQIMPGDGPPTVEAVRSSLGFGLSEKKLAAYHTFLSRLSIVYRI